MLKWNIQTFKDRLTHWLSIWFTSLVRPHLEFGNFPWYPRVEKGRNLTEGVQRLATKMVPESKELEYEERLKRMDSPSLRYSRARGVMIDTYKYTHPKYTVNIDLLVRNEDSVIAFRSTTTIFQGTPWNYKSATRFNIYSFGSVNSWNYLSKDNNKCPNVKYLQSKTI